MPRYRKLHVKTCESLDVNEMPDDFTRLFWVMLPLGLCREGRGLDNTAWVKARLFPLRLDVTPAKIEAVLCWLAERGMIQRYEVGGRRYFCIPAATWHRYQGDTGREGPTDYPPPPEPGAEQSRAGQEPVVTGSRSDADAHVDADARTPAHAPASPDPIREILGVYKEETGQKIPNDACAEEIVETVKADSVSIALWRNVIHGWLLQGWSKKNVAGMLDYYKRGEIPGDRHNGGPSPPPVPSQPQPTVIYGLDADPEWLTGVPDGNAKPA